MKVMLVNLPWHRGSAWGVRAGSRWPHIRGPQERDYLPFPFYLAYGAALLLREGFEVVLLDAIAQQMPEGPFLDRVRYERPDLLVAEVSTPSLAYDLALLGRLPRELPVVLCGPDANIKEPQVLKRYAQIHYVLQGEYEMTLLDLVRHLASMAELSKVQGLLYRRNGSFEVNPPRALLPNLDELPWPWRDPLPMYQYNDAPGGIPRPSVQMISTRGCPYNCGFCLWPQVMYGGRNYRMRSVKDTVDEMEYLVQHFGFRSIYFDDDTFNISRPRTLLFAEEVKRRRAEGRLSVPWALMGRADLMDEEVLTRLAESGLAAVKYGVESAVQELLDGIDKAMDFRKADRMIRFTQSLGIKTHLTFTFGLPGETKETIKRTIDYALNVNPDTLQFSVTTPFPGTWYFKELQKAGLIESTDWSRYDGNHSSVIRTNHLSPEDLVAAEREAYRRWRVHCWERSPEPPARGVRQLLQKGWESLRVDGWRQTVQKGADYLRWSRQQKRQSRPHRSMRTKPGRPHNLPVHLAHQVSASIRRDGWIVTGQKIARRLHPRATVNTYLNVLGVLDGTRAYKGPDLVQIDPTNNCNANCVGCWCHSDLLKDLKFRAPIKGQTLPTDLLKRVIDELAGMGTQAIYFAGGGEPFMHPELLDIVAHVKQRGMVCYINTNFTLVTPKVIQRVLDLGVDYFTLSVWAGTAKTYAITHPNKNEATFHRLKETLTLLNRTKRRHRPHIKVYHVISNLNYFELEEMLAFAKDTASEAVEYTVTDTIPDRTDCLLLSPEQLKECRAICDRIRARMGPDNTVDGVAVFNFDQFIRRLSDPRAAVAEYDSEFIDRLPCYVGWTYARILADGNVNSCLKSHRFPVGNIYEQTFAQVWNGARQREFRQHALAPSKAADPFFKLIGNDPKCQVGCYKSCDNLGENIPFHAVMEAMPLWELNMLRSAAAMLGQHHERREDAGHEAGR